MICETKGSEGHRHFGRILPLDNIQGLESAEISEVIVTGEDEEDTEVFRKRYFDSFSALAFGGNKKDYIEKVNLISGVGGCKVYPAFFGGGTVRLVIISSDYSFVSDEFVSQVKEIVDPYEFSGQGVGFAPIGHKVFVESVQPIGVNVSISAQIADDGNFDYIYGKVYKKISDYFSELSKGWAECDNIEIFADHTVYIAMYEESKEFGMAPGSDIFSVNNDGTIKFADDFKKANALFTVPIDKSKADPKAVKKLLESNDNNESGDSDVSYGDDAADCEVIIGTDENGDFTFEEVTNSDSVADVDVRFFK